jgi:Polysaccharide deacetylase
MKYRGILLVALVSSAVAAGVWLGFRHQASNADELILLIPDKVSANDPGVRLWLDAASEEGLHLEPVHDSEFVRPISPRNHCAGIILPDTIHKEASDVFVGSIQNYVERGGKLLLVYDAGSLSSDGRYAPARSRFSELVGVDYALYDKLGNGTIVWQSVGGPRPSLAQLDIPPGKYYPFDPVSSPEGPAADSTLTRYRFGTLKYPGFVTGGAYLGMPILRSGSNIVAGTHWLGKGTALFVNLPLSYLKANTDGLLLHSFLKYFAQRVVGLPYLASVPDGIGGIILNWHVDSNAAIKPLAEMESWSILKQGPYSIHITAGPDAHTIDDHRGFDVDHNLQSQARIREYFGAGNAIGSHGGWIHDYFAAHVDKDPPDTMRPFLELNKQSLEHVTHKPVTEYSSPSGDQPEWVTQWLEQNGFVAYYFTGDTGMAPTQGYREGVRAGKDIWAFPISHLGPAAAFEEMPDFGIEAPEILRWLDGMAEFASSHHTARLIYFHPPGILAYHNIVDQWMNRTAQLKSQGRFRWYTMSGLADFLNERKQVTWTSSVSGGTLTIEASHPSSLAHMTWRFPAARFAQPSITAGTAQVSKDEDDWTVVAGAGQRLEMNARMLTQ